MARRLRAAETTYGCCRIVSHTYGTINFLDCLHCFLGSLNFSRKIDSLVFYVRYADYVALYRLGHGLQYFRRLGHVGQYNVAKCLLDIGGAFRRGFVFGLKHRKSLRKIFRSRHMGRQIIGLYLTDVLHATDVRIFRIDDRRIGARERFCFCDEGVEDADQMAVPLVAAVQRHLALQSWKRECLLDCGILVTRRQCLA